MKTILVTGGVGFIGSNLIKRLFVVGERPKDCEHRQYECDSWQGKTSALTSYLSESSQSISTRTSPIADQKQRKQTGALHLLGLGGPEDIANACIYLCGIVLYFLSDNLMM